MSMLLFIIFFLVFKDVVLEKKYVENVEIVENVENVAFEKFIV